jgi:hypothetical protein
MNLWLCLSGDTAPLLAESPPRLPRFRSAGHSADKIADGIREPSDSDRGRRSRRAGFDCQEDRVDQRDRQVVRALPNRGLDVRAAADAAQHEQTTQSDQGRQNRPEPFADGAAFHIPISHTVRVIARSTFHCHAERPGVATVLYPLLGVRLKSEGSMRFCLTARKVAGGVKFLGQS